MFFLFEDGHSIWDGGSIIFYNLELKFKATDSYYALVCLTCGYG
jgi:hypothetical protein